MATKQSIASFTWALDNYLDNTSLLYMDYSKKV